MPEIRLLRLVGWFGCSATLVRLICSTAVRFVTEYLYYDDSLQRYLRLQSDEDKEQFITQLQKVPHGDIAYGVMYNAAVPLNQKMEVVINTQVQQAIQKLEEAGYIKVSGNLAGCAYIQPTWKGRWQWIKQSLFKKKC